MSTRTLNKKIAVITGGTGYLGSCLVKRLASEGMTVVLLCRESSYEKAKELLSHCGGDGHKVYVCDLSKYDDVSLVIQKIEDEVGPLFLGVHAASEKPVRKKITETTYDAALAQVNGTIMPAFNILSCFSRAMKARKEGVLIGVTTAGVVKPEATASLGAYIPAKYAVQGMLVMLHEELAPHGVAVHSIAPGFMADGMNTDIPRAFVAMVTQKSPHKKLVTAEDIAEKIVRFCYCELGGNQELTTVMAPEYE